MSCTGSPVPGHGPAADVEGLAVLGAEDLAAVLDLAVPALGVHPPTDHGQDRIGRDHDLDVQGSEDALTGIVEWLGPTQADFLPVLGVPDLLLLVGRLAPAEDADTAEGLEVADIYALTILEDAGLELVSIEVTGGE